MKELVLIGNGKLADAIYDGFHNYSDIPVKKYVEELEVGKDTIFVHVGSGRQYYETLELALKHGASYIQAATEKNIQLEPPPGTGIIYIHAPNLDINIIKLFYLLRSAKGLFKDEPVTIIESHQKEKKSQPGTALKFCDYLQVPRENIVSIRDPEYQKKLHVTSLDHHAFHRIQVGNAHSSITIETKIEGATSYVEGLARIVQSLPKLDNGNYEIDDLVACL